MREDEREGPGVTGVVGDAGPSPAPGFADPMAVRESRDAIADVWGARTPYRGTWPTRPEEKLVAEPERWVPSVCLLCSTGCGVEVGVAKLRAALLGVTRVGSVGTLQDLQGLSLLTDQAWTTWTILYQGAKELHDDALLALSAQAREQARRTLAWIRTMIE